MRIERMTVTNFGSFYGEHVLPIAGRGLVFVQGVNRDEPRMNSNGAGKSTGTCDALEWALYGVVPKGDTADSVVNEQAGKNCSVAVVLTEGPDYTLEVLRFRKQGGKKSSVRYWVNSEERTALDTKETQRLLELELGLDHQIFRACVVFGQNDRFYFADATDVQRQEIVTKLFEMGPVDEWLTAAKAIRDEAYKAVILSQEARIKAEAARDAYQESIKTIRDSAQSWAAEQEGRRVAAQQRTMELEKYLAETKARLAALDATKARLAEVQAIPEDSFRPAGLADLEARERELEQSQGAMVGSAPPPPRELAVLRERQATLASAPVPSSAGIDQLREDQRFHETAKAGLGVSWKQAEAEVQRLQAEIDRYQSMGVGKCRECGQQVTAGHLHREIERLGVELAEKVASRGRIAEEGAEHTGELERIAAEIKALEEEARQAVEARRVELAGIAGEILTLEGRHQAAMAAHQAAASQVHAELCRVRDAHKTLERKWQEDLAEHRGRVAGLQQELAHEPTLQGYIQQTLANLTETAATLADLAERANPFTAQLETIDHEEAARTAAARQAEAAEAEVEGRLKLAEFWVEACGPKGIKSYILDTRLAELTQAANAGVSALTGGTHWVQLDTVTAGKSSKTVRNQINLRVFRYNPDGSVLERGYKSYSGGERQRVSLGIDFGLAWLVASRAKKQYRELFLDEVFRHLDKLGKESIVELLRQFSQTRDTVFAIEHDDEFREHFDSELVIEKINGQSRYVEGENGQGVGAGAEEKPRRKKAVRRVPATASVSQT